VAERASSPRVQGGLSALRAERSVVDWTEIHERLVRSAEVVDRLLEPDSARAREIMDERARSLAKPLAFVAHADANRDGVHELACFSAGGEELAIETRYVLKVGELPPLEPLPWVPPLFLGVINYQGVVLPVVALHLLLARPARGASTDEHDQMIVLGTTQPEIALAIQSADDVIRPRAEQIAAPDALSATDVIVRGILGGTRLVLHGDVLLRDPRLFLIGD
jgi:chemotaxis signal transduction protein